MSGLRPEVLCFTRDDGGLDLVDLLLERTVSLTPEEARGLAEDDAMVVQKLKSLLLLEGDLAASMRLAAWSARTQGRPTAAPAPARQASWQDAADLPRLVAPAWRDPERFRRLAEDSAAGRRYLMLPGFVEPEAAARLAEAAAALPFARLATDLVQAERRLLQADDLVEWRALMGSPALRRLFGGVLGVELPDALNINAWRFRRGDLLGVHPDGRLYRGTLSLGLSAGWTAADGGAIAFGEPTPQGFVVRERWLPHLGDALLFAPTHDTWHAVEPVLSDRTRLSLTGWWTAAG